VSGEGIGWFAAKLAIGWNGCCERDRSGNVFLPDGGIDKLNHWTMTVLEPVEGISPTGKKTLERIARRRGYRNWRFLT